MLQEAHNLRRAGEDFARQDRGSLRIAATHSQARYALPQAVPAFSASHPLVSLRMHQGTPRQVAEVLLSGEARHGPGVGTGRSQQDQLMRAHIVQVLGRR